MPDNADELLTTGDILRDLRGTLPGLSEHRLKYALTNYRIDPVRRIGVVRVWSRSQLPMIRSALSRIADRRGVLANG